MPIGSQWIQRDIKKVYRIYKKTQSTKQFCFNSKCIYWFLVEHLLWDQWRLSSPFFIKQRRSNWCVLSMGLSRHDASPCAERVAHVQKSAGWVLAQLWQTDSFPQSPLQFLFSLFLVIVFRLSQSDVGEVQRFRKLLAAKPVTAASSLKFAARFGSFTKRWTDVHFGDTEYIFSKLNPKCHILLAVQHPQPSNSSAYIQTRVPHWTRTHQPTGVTVIGSTVWRAVVPFINSHLMLSRRHARSSSDVQHIHSVKHCWGSTG